MKNLTSFGYYNRNCALILKPELGDDPELCLYFIGCSESMQASSAFFLCLSATEEPLDHHSDNSFIEPIEPVSDVALLKLLSSSPDVTRVDPMKQEP
jgi:hypothetical protein